MNFWYLALMFFGIASCAVQKPLPSDQTDTGYFLRHDFIRLFDTDPLGYFYVVDRNDRLIKFDSARQQMYTVVNNNLGKVHSLDTGNPFKIMLFYRDQQTIVLYDRTLSELQRVPLIHWGFKDVTATSLSSDNAIWIFDGEKRTLMKMSDQGQSIISSDPFDIINPASIRPDFIYDFDHYLLLKETGKNISIFNDFGNYLSSPDIKEDMFTLLGDQLLVNDGAALQIYRLPAGEKLSQADLQEHLKSKRIYSIHGKYYVADERGVFGIF